MNNEVSAHKINSEQGIKLFKKYCHCVIILKDGRLATTGDYKEIKIVDPANKFNVDISVTIDEKNDFKIRQLDNGLLITNDENLTLWSLTKTELKKEFCFEQKIRNMISLTNNRFAGVTKEGILIFKGEAPYNKEPIAIIGEKCEDNDYYYTYLIQLKGKEILLSNNNNICLWDLTNYTLIEKNDIYRNGKPMIQIDDDNIMISNQILNFAKWEKKPWNDNTYWGTYFICGFTTKDGKVICVTYGHQQDWGNYPIFILYDPKTNTYEKTDFDLADVSSIAVLDDHTFYASSDASYTSDDSLIVVKY